MCSGVDVEVSIQLCRCSGCVQISEFLLGSRYEIELVAL